MLRFRYVPHTADVAFVAYGSSIEEAVENAALAMLNVMLDVKKIAKENSASKRVTIKVRASSIDSLVWYVLQDILSTVDERKLNAYGFKVTRLDEDGRGNRRVLEGELKFKDIGRDFSLLEVKAVTPHDLRVARKGKRWSIRIVLDV